MKLSLRLICYFPVDSQWDHTICYKTLPFILWTAFVSAPRINWLCLCGSISGLFILLLFRMWLPESSKSHVWSSSYSWWTALSWVWMAAQTAGPAKFPCAHWLQAPPGVRDLWGTSCVVPPVAIRAGGWHGGVCWWRGPGWGDKKALKSYSQRKNMPD